MLRSLAPGQRFAPFSPWLARGKSNTDLITHQLGTNVEVYVPIDSDLTYRSVRQQVSKDSARDIGNANQRRCRPIDRKSLSLNLERKFPFELKLK